MSVNARIILNRLGPVLHEGELFGTAFFSKWKSEFKASGKPVSLDTALSKAIEDGVVVGKNINNDGSLSYKLAEDVRPLTAEPSRDCRRPKTLRQYSYEKQTIPNRS